MSMKLLGQTFDIHAGGEDLIFPHHEDEIAQSEAATGQPFVRTWLHVTHLKVNGEKMSKSKGNDFTITQLIDKGYTPAAIRMLMLQAHYRKELNFSFEGLDKAKTALRRLIEFRRRLDETPVRPEAPPSALARIASDALRAFEEALDDDLNTPNAFAVLFPFVKDVNAELDRVDAVRKEDLEAARAAIERMDDVLGVIELASQDAAVLDDDLAGWVEAMLEKRREARGRRDFATADAIRDELAAAGVVVEDTAAGVRWKKE
jgi:cysteinyl-tRNA synthetase